jgi:hypothetical protein
MNAWPPVVYVLCLAASAICAGLLVRNYRRTRSALLMWSAACFVFLALNNLAVVVDLIILPTDIDLQIPRLYLSLAGLVTLIYGFVWEVD